MECPTCKSDTSFAELLAVAVKGRATCKKCGKEVVLANKGFIRFMLCLLLLIAGASSYFFIANLALLHLGVGWSMLSLLAPWVIMVLLFGILVVPAIEVKAQS